MKKKILVVDDSRALLFLLSEEIRDQGDEPLCCESGEEALEKETKFQPDVVLSDINMPGGMDGFQFSKEMKKKNPTIPIIIMTAITPLPSDIAPANAIIEKPFSMEHFYQVANTL